MRQDICIDATSLIELLAFLNDVLTVSQNEYGKPIDNLLYLRTQLPQ